MPAVSVPPLPPPVTETGTGTGTGTGTETATSGAAAAGTVVGQVSMTLDEDGGSTPQGGQGTLSSPTAASPRTLAPASPLVLGAEAGRAKPSQLRLNASSVTDTPSSRIRRSDSAPRGAVGGLLTPGKRHGRRATIGDTTVARALLGTHSDPRGRGLRRVRSEMPKAVPAVTPRPSSRGRITMQHVEAVKAAMIAAIPERVRELRTMKMNMKMALLVMQMSRRNRCVPVLWPWWCGAVCALHGT